MARRKGWDQLSSTYRKRLLNKGITEDRYSQGKPIASARGHAATPEHGIATLRIEGRTVTTKSYAALAARAGIIDIIPVFDTLTRAEQNRLGKLYIKSFFARGTGGILTKDQRHKRRLSPKDRRIYRHSGDEQINGRIEFQEYIDSNREKKWDDKEDWTAFRSGYTSFSEAPA